MTYFIGDNLDRRIRDLGLLDLEQKLVSITEGSGSWPAGELQIPAAENQLEQVRTVLYSLLHRHGLKDQFTVKVNIQNRFVSLSIRSTSQLAAFVKSQGVQPGSPEDREPLGEEGFGDLLSDETIPEDFK